MAGSIQILKQSDIFFGLTNTQLEIIAGLCSERVYQTGEVIFPEGAVSDELYVIIKGEVEIQVNPALVSTHGQRKLPYSTIATLRRGESFGEMALVDQGVRSAAAIASQKDTRVLILPSQKLLTTCEMYPELGYRLMANLAADMALKMRNTGLLIREELLYGDKHPKSPR